MLILVKKWPKVDFIEIFLLKKEYSKEYFGNISWNIPQNILQNIPVETNERAPRGQLGGRHVAPRSNGNGVLKFVWTRRDLNTGRAEENPTA